MKVISTFDWKDYCRSGNYELLQIIIAQAIGGAGESIRSGLHTI